MSSTLPVTSQPEIGEEQIEEDLRKLGLVEGDHVSVALSLKSIGHVRGGPDAFIDALLNVVGPKGTVMMNTHTRSYSIFQIDPNFIFDANSTAPDTGLVPAKFMNRKDSIRSRHPTCSIAVQGRLAQYLTSEHDEFSDPYRPIEKLAQVGGKFLFIGTNGRLVAIRHQAQRRAGLFIIPIFMGVRYKTLRGDSKLFVWNYPPCTKSLPKLNPKLRAMGVLRNGSVGMAPTYVGYVSKLLDSMSKILEENPALNLCDDVFCVYCRELERRLNLYEAIENPLIFQRSMLARRVIGFRNKLILKKYSCISFDTPKNKRRLSWDIVIDAILRRSIPIASKMQNEEKIFSNQEK